MNSTLSQLRADHANFGRLLDVVTFQVDALARRAMPNVQLLSAVISYFRTYPSRFHHPKEDVICGHLIGHVGSLANEIYEVVEDHRHLLDRLTLFEKALHLLDANRPASQQKFRIYADLFVANERKHMESEEHSSFPLALEKLTPAEWVDIEAEVASLKDHLFGAHVEANFIELRQTIIASQERLINETGNEVAAGTRLPRRPRGAIADAH